MNPVEQFEIELMKLNPEGDQFYLQVDELLESVSQELYEALIPSIFSFFESHPIENCGMPGTLVHLVEDFYPNYKSILLQSLAKAPSYNAILMVNRILNSKLSKQDREEYISTLVEIRDNQEIKPELRKDAEEYIDYQSN